MPRRVKGALSKRAMRKIKDSRTNPVVLTLMFELGVWIIFSSYKSAPRQQIISKHEGQEPS